MHTWCIILCLVIPILSLLLLVPYILFTCIILYKTFMMGLEHQGSRALCYLTVQFIKLVVWSPFLAIPFVLAIPFSHIIVNNSRYYYLQSFINIIGTLLHNIKTDHHTYTCTCTCISFTVLSILVSLIILLNSINLMHYLCILPKVTRP